MAYETLVACKLLTEIDGTSRLTVAVLYDDVWASNVTISEPLLMKEFDGLMRRLSGTPN